MSASGIQKEANFICNDDKDTEQELDCFDVCFICEKSMKDVEKCRRQCHGSFHPSCLGRLSAFDGELLSEECATGRFPWDRMVSSFCKLFFSCCCFWFALDVYLWQFMVFFLIPDSRKCFVCKHSDAGVVVPCSVPDCSRCYHKECLGAFLPEGLISDSNLPFSCPRHSCFTCQLKKQDKGHWSITVSYK